MEHVLQCLVQLSRIDKGRPEHGAVQPGIVLEGIQSGVHILDVQLRVLHPLTGQPVKGLYKNSRIVGDNNVGHQRIVILDLFQPLCLKKPVQYPGRRRLQHVQLILRLLRLQGDLFLGIEISQDLQAHLPAQEIVVILVFFVDLKQRFYINIPVPGAEQTPEGVRDLIYILHKFLLSCIWSYYTMAAQRPWASGRCAAG